MTVTELKERLDRGDKIQILDVREHSEWNVANIGGTLVPLGELPKRIDELDSQTEFAVLCHHGMRSAQAVGFLRQNGFAKAHNIVGGIEAWSLTVDPTVARY